SSDQALTKAEGGYLSARLRVPHRAEGPELPAEIGVRAVDDAGLVTEELLDLTILDDLEAPGVAIDVPGDAVTIDAGAFIAVEGRVDDNFYVSEIVPIFRAPDGTEAEGIWKGLKRRDRVERV